MLFQEYDPEIVLVSCGFDAAAGHPAPLGGYSVSAACFAHMTRDLMQLANGKVGTARAPTATEELYTFFISFSISRNMSQTRAHCLIHSAE